MSLGELVVAWRLLDLAVIADSESRKAKGRKADYFNGKILQATFYTDTTLPKTLASLEICLRDGREILDIPDTVFGSSTF
jgi:hypothetical protein